MWFYIPIEENMECLAPWQISSFGWTAAWEKILMNDNLIKCGYIIHASRVVLYVQV